jgi:DNA-binding GntR family transcriptional regulator
LLDATPRYAPREFFAAVPAWPEAAAHDHHAVFTALRDPDAEAARAAMGRHVTGAGALLAEHLARPRGTAR